jgi:hypothetical protein
VLDARVPRYVVAEGQDVGSIQLANVVSAVGSCEMFQLLAGAVEEVHKTVHGPIDIEQPPQPGVLGGDTATCFG